MRIGIFTETYKPVLNGVVTSVINYTQGFRELGHDVTIFCPTYDIKPEKEVIYVNSEKFPGKSGYEYIMPFTREIRERAKKLDIIHAHHPFMMGAKARRLAKRYKKPFIFTNHTKYEQYLHYVPVLGPLFKEGINWWLADFAKKCTLVTTPSEGMKNILLKNGFPKKSTISVTNGVELSQFKTQISDGEKLKIRKEIGADPNDIIMIFTGRMAEEKNISFLIKAFKLINLEVENTKLLLVGSGTEEKMYKELISNLKLQRKVLMIGQRDREVMHRYYQASNLFTIASTSETQGLVTIEAMAAGLPAIGVIATGTEDIIKNDINGYLTQPKIKPFAKKTIELIKNQEVMKKLSKNAPDSVDRFSILNASKKMLEAYKFASELAKNQYK